MIGLKVRWSSGSVFVKSDHSSTDTFVLLGKTLPIIIIQIIIINNESEPNIVTTWCDAKTIPKLSEQKEEGRCQGLFRIDQEMFLEGGTVVGCCYWTR